LRPSASQFPIIVSQDGGTQSVTDVISKFVNENSKISFIHHKEQAKPPAGIGAQSYFYIAQHYKWALNKVFFEMHYKTLTFFFKNSLSLVQNMLFFLDDLDIADDFFSYFTALKPVLIADPTVWCIRWMLTADLWKELSKNWPKIYWDDWMRRQDIRKNRVCIRPEVSRTSHNNNLAGKGSSG
uniref:Alpha-1,3-mannosyl-glycoprotein 2-beta-N-acetylglucosaminyltransferase n=1 Tax=Gongylonema pulchrum TaxID=637853 RepID=A0A183EIY3_9BILA